MTVRPDSIALAPWTLAAPHVAAPYAFFLDRAGTAEPSFAGSRPSSQLVIVSDGRVRCFRDGRCLPVHSHPIDAIEAFVERSRAEPLAAPSWLHGRLLPRTVGYLAYELGCFVERTRRAPVDLLGTPLAVLSTYDAVDAWDPRSGAIASVRFADRGAGEVEHEERGSHAAAWEHTERSLYDAAFARVQAAIGAGDIYQANLSRRAIFELDQDPGVLYRRLRGVQPVPHGAFLDCGGFQLLSNSPECFLVRRGDAVTTLPIKGTRPRRAERAADAAMKAELAADAKERAEHLMIVDLERNDLGRIARTGSVRVHRFADVHSYATVHHMVSDVRARLRPGIGLGDLLRATFPGGSITGAPKIAAIDLLADVERYTRGPYTGAIGMWNGGDMLELSIAIRTAVVREGRACYSAGGGIVADSDRDREWAETELKIRAFRDSLDTSALHEAVA